MKTIAKTSYIILGGALMLSACAQEDIPVDRPDGGDRRIVFHTLLPELTTRAKEIATDLPHFYMTAFDESDDELIIEGKKLKEYIDSVLIEKDGGRFISDECVWPDPGKESDILHFFAYYPALNNDASLANITTVSESNKKTVGYKVNGFRIATDIAGQEDFVTAYASGSMADNLFSGIKLEFRHQLSRIEVKAKGTHKSCDIEIAGVRIENVAMHGNYEFQTDTIDGKCDGNWTDKSLGTAEYIFHPGDTIVTVGAEPVSILGRQIGDNDNCAMLLPGEYDGWNYAEDSTNDEKGMYLNVLLRIIDKTPTTGKGTQQYPYFDNSQGLNAMNIQRVYFAVDSITGAVSKRVYKKNIEDGEYFSDEACTQSYTLATDEKVREFGWAALPISADWQPGYSYTYTLDYSFGVGLHGPEVEGETAPKAGDPIISDRIGISVSVNNWQGLNGSTTSVEEVPGS